MKRSPLYGTSTSLKRRSRTSGPGWTAPPPGQLPDLPPSPERRLVTRARAAYRRFERPVLVLSAAAAALALFVTYSALQPRPKAYTQRDIDQAVAYALKHRPDPSRASIAAAVVAPSVVRVTGYDPLKLGQAEDSAAESPHEDAVAVGSGVVIDERGTILTNLHVAGATARLKVTFAGGMEVEADIIGAQPENDLAIIRPRSLPDDLQPAVLASTRDLAPGDEVVAVGFPFGLGPSVSAGVISGMNRSWRGKGDQRPRNLIQFDAAANPGNSGGPLVNRHGEVLGIVTGILNPNNQAVFIGIAFAVPIESAAAGAGRSPF